MVAAESQVAADMGNCVSNSEDREAKARSDAIDRQIEEDQKKFKKECKILLLGMSRSLCLFTFALSLSVHIFVLLAFPPHIPVKFHQTARNSRLTHDVYILYAME